MVSALERLREWRGSAEQDRETADQFAERLRRMTLSDFAAAGLIVPILSDVVGEKIYFVSDNATIEIDDNWQYRGCVVYRASELRQLLTCCADMIRTAHEVKRMFGGSVIG